MPKRESSKGMTGPIHPRDPTPVSDRMAHTLLEKIKESLTALQSLLRTGLAEQKITNDLLRDIREELTPPPEDAKLEFIATLPNGTIIQGENLMAVINDIQSVPLSLVKFVPDSTAGGKTIEVPVTGPVSWSNSASSVVTLTPSEDTFSAVAAAAGPNGASTITASADGLTASIEIIVVDSEVASLTIVAGEPTTPTP